MNVHCTVSLNKFKINDVVPPCRHNIGICVQNIEVILKSFFIVTIVQWTHSEARVELEQVPIVRFKQTSHNREAPLVLDDGTRSRG